MRTLIVLTLFISACSTAPKSVPRDPDTPADWTATDEVEYLKYVLETQRQNHEAQLKAVYESQQVAVPEMPAAHVLTPQVCVSEPIFDVYGRYVRTTVRCK